MTIFSSTASPGQRWKIFLPAAALIEGKALNTCTASALLRSRWLNSHALRDSEKRAGTPGHRPH